MPARDLRFLVVEDHPFQRTALVQLLRAMGASAVQEAEDGAAALAVLRDSAQPIDIVISDVSMPGMDGMELVRHLSELGARVSLVLASAVGPELLATIANMARGYHVRLLGVVGKPPSAAKLAPLLHLHRKGIADPHVQAAGVTLEELATSWTNHDFDPWLEPEVELPANALRAFHAVPRWRHPERGSLGPDAFLPSVRARGLWDEFSWMMLERSVWACAQWRMRGIQASLSIPLLLEGWSEPTLGPRVTRMVSDGGLRPSDVALLVPDSAFSSAGPVVLENLARLRLEGFSLGLAHPAAIPTAAKVPGVFTDMRFPVALADTEDLQRLLELARAANLRCCAQGVEHIAHWQTLTKSGCESASGPLIAPVMHLDQAMEWALHKTRGMRKAEPHGKPGGRSAP